MQAASLLQRNRLSVFAEAVEWDLKSVAGAAASSGD